MTIVVLLVVLSGFLILEHYWAGYALRSIDLHSECDHSLAEPDQTIIWSARVNNYSRLPIPFVRLVQSFPNEALLHAERGWRDAYCRDNILSYYAEHRITLPGRRSVTRTLELSFKERGIYRVGNYQLSAGDLLGFKEVKCHGDGKKIVIMPRRSTQQTAIDAVGGFLGDISVRRFILEDPILTVGFRDYTGREPMRSIAWNRTAQSGTLQVKQYDHTAERHVVILLNTEGATDTQLEECLRLTRSVCEKLEQQKVPYGFRTNGNLPGPVGKIHTIQEGLGAQHLNTILYGLGCADSTCFHSFRYLTRQTLRKRKGSESYIVITPDDKGDVRSCIVELSNAVGSPVCVLRGNVEVRPA